eukprot:TRINITY_DN1120_c0_g1_i1.p1 TRINITY_DN1120_c0_g1~~TRINITY_DN1120_c0_g1_i1.p1  ORF type:complete len:355 (+),score=39.19 TRINITY_DN1120_c0_g1_i1:59-1123(+)
MSRRCYHLLHEIDHGAQATVYKAVMVDGGDDVNNAEQYVAVKIFKKRGSPAAMMSELSTLTAVQGHPNIVRLIDGSDANAGTPGIVLEFCCEDLRKSVERRPFAQDRAVEIMRDVLSALVHVHELNIVHRDVKPANIAIAQDGCARLMDFGIATFLADSAQMRRFCGTVGFAAPELYRRTAYGLPVDVFALGATCYFILSGRLAFATPGVTEKTLVVRTTQCEVSFDRDFDHVSEHVKETIKWLMRTQASKRPSSRRALRWLAFDAEFAHVGRQEMHDFDLAEVPHQMTPNAEATPHPPAVARVGRTCKARLAYFRCGSLLSNAAADAGESRHSAGTSSDDRHSENMASLPSVA